MKYSSLIDLAAALEFTALIADKGRVMKPPTLKDRNRLLMLVLIVIITATSMAGILGWGLYTAALNDQRQWLQKLVQSQVNIIEAFIAVENRHRQLYQTQNIHEETVKQIAAVHGSFSMFGKTGEFVLGRRVGETIEFLLEHRDTKHKLTKSKIPDPVLFESKMSEPMRLALLGKSGTVIGLDYQNVTVLAAYEPIKNLNIGLVAKIDLAEIRAPYIKVGFYGGLSTLFIILFAAFLTHRVSKPLVDRLETSIKELQTSEQRMRDFSESISDWFWETDKDHRLSHISGDGFLKAGFDVDRCLGKTRVELATTNSDKQKLQQYSANLRLRKPFRDFRYGLMNKHGTQIWVSISGQPVFDVHGDFMGYRGMAANITEIKQAEDALKEAELQIRDREERYALIMNGMKDAVWDWNIIEDTLYTSTKFSDLLGYEPGALNITIDGWLERIHPAHREKHESLLVAHLKGETPFYSCEYQVVQKNGDYIWVLDRAKALCDETGRACRIAGSITNINKRRLAEDGLRQSQKLAAVGQFSSGIAHEFNNILVGIRGFTDMAIMDADSPEDVCSHLQEVQGATDRATKLTKDMLAFSRGQNVKVTRVTFDLNELINESAAFVKPMLPANIHLHIDCAAKDLMISGDPQQISQVLLNLSINARDAMPDGGDLTICSRVIELRTEQIYKHPGITPGPFAQIFVCDTGTGIDDATLARLFEPFFTTKDVGKGTGLGLSVVYGFVDQMDGFIDVESTLGQGTTFLVNLPQYKAQQT